MISRRKFVLGGLIAAPAIVAIDRLMPVKLWKPQFDPIRIALIRQHLPNIIAYDICSVQPMTHIYEVFYHPSAEVYSVSFTKAES